MMPRHLLLISGPSGGGKSTFIRQLAAGTLAPEILALLPTPCGNWPLVEANNVLKGDLSRESLFQTATHADGLLLHYDIVFIHCYRLKGYGDDPAMDLLKTAASLQVVFVKPDAEVLQKQFLERQGRNQKAKSQGSQLWGRLFRRPLRRILAPWTGKPTLSTMELYSRNKWLAGCYSQWESFIHGLEPQYSEMKMIVVEPASGAGGSETFRLIMKSENPSPTNPAGNE